MEVVRQHNPYVHYWNAANQAYSLYKTYVHPHIRQAYLDRKHGTKKPTKKYNSRKMRNEAYHKKHAEGFKKRWTHHKEHVKKRHTDQQTSLGAHEPFGSATIGGATNTFTRLGKTKHHKFSKKATVEPPTRTYQNRVYQTTGQIGLQTSQPLSATGNAPYPTATEITSLFASYKTLDSSTGLSYNAPSIIPGTNPAAALSNTRDMVLNYCREHHMLTNVSNFPVFAKIYDFMYTGKPNYTYDMNSIWQDGLQVMENAAAGATNADTYIGMSPMYSKRLRQFYKLKKEVSIVVAPGSVHTHTVFCEFHRKFKGEEYSATTTGIPIRGSMFTFLVYYGPPHNLAVSSTVTTPIASFDIMTTREVKYTPFSVPLVEEGRIDTDGIPLIGATSAPLLAADNITTDKVT